MQLIALSTDFGLGDWFVGVMKGVILTLNARASIVDVTHGIPPGDIAAGAFALAASYRYFPRGTVHVVVVDPGVGSSRRAIAVETGSYFFVGPDNGVLSLALGKERIRGIHALENQACFLSPVSRTFHGRDVFAPAGAHLSRGLPIGKLGGKLEGYARLAWPEPTVRGGRVEGQVVYIDRFGNGITNLSNELAGVPAGGSASLPARSSASRRGEAAGARSQVAWRCEVYSRRRRVCQVREFYQAVPAGALVAVAGSSGYLEVAISGGSAKERLGVETGTRVVLRRSLES